MLLICVINTFKIFTFSYSLAFAVANHFLSFFFFPLWSLQHGKDCTGLKAQVNLFGAGKENQELENRVCKQQGFKICHVSWFGLFWTIVVLYSYTWTKYRNICIDLIFVCMCTYKSTKWYTVTLVRWLWSYTVWF